MNRRGAEGERIARLYLEAHGYRIIATNFHSRWGELDIVALTPDRVLVFFEVKSYAPRSMVEPLAAITPVKVHKIKKTIRYFLMRHPYYIDYEMRIDVIVTDGITVKEHLLAV